MNHTMKVSGKGTIQPLEDKPKSRCRRWRLWLSTDHGRKSKRFEGTYTQAESALASWREKLAGSVVAPDAFGLYAESWRVYRAESGDYAPNTIANDLRNVRALRRSPADGRRLDAITPQTCREDLMWIKKHPQVSGKEELSGTTMDKIYLCMYMVLKQAKDDGKIASNPMESVQFPKCDTAEREALSWGELMGMLDWLDSLPLNAYVVAVYAIICEGLRRGEACALMDADVTAGKVVIRYGVKERTGAIGSTKNGKTRILPTVPRLWAKVQLWREAKAARGVIDAPTLACSVNGSVLRPQNLYRWWIDVTAGTPYEGIDLHQLRHSNLTHVARHMSVWDLMRYAGWSTPDPAMTYIHDDFSAMSSGVSDAWDCTDDASTAPDLHREKE